MIRSIWEDFKFAVNVVLAIIGVVVCGLLVLLLVAIAIAAFGGLY